jgi:hypothetical protein
MPQSSVLETIHAQSDSANDNANKKPQPRKHPNTKRTGELAEAAFVVKAASLGYAVSKPWGDSERYDFILDSGPRTWRVQIKCTESLNANGYQVQSTYTDQKKKGHYTSHDIDVLVAYILPLNLWYVVIGGYVYKGSAIPSLANAYIFGDLNGKIWSLTEAPANVWTRTLLLSTGRTISSFGQDAAGEVYVVDLNGSVLKLVPQ